MLTDTAIKNAKPQTKPVKLSDGMGMHLLITPAGGKLWRMSYRFDDKQKTLALGKYPEMSLVVARAELAKARALLQQDIDPGAQRKSKKRADRAAADNSFETVARAWWARWSPGRSPRHAEYVIRRLETDVFPVMGARPVDRIEADELREMAEKIEARGAGDIARRALQTTSQIFRYAVIHKLAARNPGADFKPGDVLQRRTKSNFARLDAKELPGLLRAVEAYAGTPATRLAMKLLALTFVRTGELIGARWCEFDFEAAQWQIPAERMKMRKLHIVPLSLQSIEVLRTLHIVSGHRDLLFPGERDHDKPMSNNTIL